MKVSFTTLGCPDWDLDTIISKSIEYGYDGVDFRGYNGEMNIYDLPEFSTNLSETIEKFEQANLKVSCFSSSVHIISKENFESNQHEIEKYAELCKAFNTKYIRVFGGNIGTMERSYAVELISENLKSLIEITQKCNVKLLIETHDDWTKFDDIKNILKSANKESLAVLWDVHHPCRTVGEDPIETWENLGDWIEYTHWKDSYLNDNHPNGFQYCLMGEGDIPFKQILKIFKNNNYTGWYTLEWEKKWHPEIEEPEIAFPQYALYMRNLNYGEMKE